MCCLLDDVVGLLTLGATEYLSYTVLGYHRTMLQSGDRIGQQRHYRRDIRFRMP